MNVKFFPLKYQPSLEEMKRRQELQDEINSIKIGLFNNWKREGKTYFFIASRIQRFNAYLRRKIKIVSVL